MRRDLFLLRCLKKNKKKIPDKNRINELFKHDVTIYDELYNNEEAYLNNNKL